MQHQHGSVLAAWNHRVSACGQRRGTLCGVIWTLVLGCFLSVAGCDRSTGRLDAIATLALTNVSGASAQLHADWADGTLTMSDSLDLAHVLLDQGDPRGPGFGAAVLQTIEDRRGSINDAGEFEIFWRRVARVACKVAVAEFEAGRYDEASRWVFAGTTRWQTDQYWLKYSDHDAIASYCLARTGRMAEAVARLRDRPSLEGDAAEALRVLERRGGE